MLSEMEFSCFSSSDPHAVNAHQLYDFNVAKGNLWMRGGQDIPLPHCFPISPPPDGRCLVCLEQKVYAVCRNLTAGVKMVMEAEGKPVEISESECPKPPSDDTWKWWQIFILILLIIIAVLVVYGLWKKCCKTSKCLTRVKEEKAVERVGEEEEEEAAHLRRPEMECDAEAAV